MKIESVHIENFRAIKDQVINFDDYTCFVGPNGAGKSTILCALNVFFREYSDATTDLSKLKDEDFHRKNTREPIKITVTFSELSVEAKTDLSSYVRQDKLIVSAVAHYDESSGRAEVMQYGNRLGFQDFRAYFERDKAGAKANDLKELFSDLQTKYPDLPKATTKEAMAQVLRDYEAAHPANCCLIASEDQFYGVSKGKNLLSKYMQWVYIPAVKDAGTEQVETKNSALGQLLSRTVRSRVNFSQRIETLRNQLKDNYKAILAEEQHVLEDLSDSLGRRLQEWSHPSATVAIKWHHDEEKGVKVEEPLAKIVVGERGFEGELPRFGNGLQRSYVIALLQELASLDDENSPCLILGCEEPELYQHPPQAKYLSDVLHKLADHNAQIIVTTHNAYFISGLNFEHVRMVRHHHGSEASVVSQMKLEDLATKITLAGERPLMREGMLAKIHQALTPSLAEMFFSDALVLVEGYEDVAYLHSYLILSGRFHDFRKHGCHIVPCMGKSEIPRPLAIARHMGIPVFVIFDGDGNETRPDARPKHEKDNSLLLQICSYAAEAPFQADHLWKADLVMWAENMGATVKAEIGDTEWVRILNETYAAYGNPGGLQKNSLAVGYALEKAWNEGRRAASLDRLCESIIGFAERVKTHGLIV